MSVKLVRYISLALLIAWMGVIFCFSAQDEKDSAKVSEGVVVKVAEVVYPDYEKLEEPQKKEVLDKFYMPIRKAAHFFEFFVLAGIAFVFFLTFKKLSGKSKILLPLCFSVIYALSDELHQSSVAGRACRFTDVCIDSAGVLLAVLIAFLIIRKTRGDKIG
ncbi:MAG: VanZ family protein [Clostridia bacterium]|nr:VanZ family protein [Clostridia bacterium]